MNWALWYIAGILTVYGIHKAFSIWGSHVLKTARMKPDNMQAVVEHMSQDALIKWRNTIDAEIIKRREA